MATTTSRLALPVPVASDPNNVPADMLRLANALDAIAVVYLEGTAAARPSAAIHGRLYLATDTSAVYYDTGSTWIQLNVNPGSVVTTKGDLLVASGSGALARLAVGSNGQFLQAQSGATNGVQWATSPLGLPLALTGAASATRYVGATTSGAPTSGTFAVGDLVVAQNGHAWICTAAGSPGTWVDAGAWSLGQSLTHTGALAATQFAGGVTSGAPTSGTFAKGDFVIGQDGSISICTAAGTPGTWVTLPFVPPFGHLGATGGFQTVGTSGAYSVFPGTAQEVRGGMTVGTNSLVVPIAGRYEIKHRGYATGTGGAGDSRRADITVNDSAVPPASQSGASLQFPKPDGQDYQVIGSVEKRLAAGDVIRHFNLDVGAAMSTYGSDGYNGAWIEARWVSP